jgi:hypothetical protein
MKFRAALAPGETAGVIRNFDLALAENAGSCADRFVLGV